MLFTKWEGILYHESLKDLIPSEYFAMEIFPSEIEDHKKSEEGKSIDYVLITALIEEEIADLGLGPPEERETVLFSAVGSFNSKARELDLRYLDKATVLKASFSSDGKVMEGQYISYRDGQSAGVPIITGHSADGQPEVEMKFKLLSCPEVEK